MLPSFLAPERHETPDFVLRSWRPGDGSLLAEAVNASYEHLRPYMAWAKPEQSVEESERTCRELRGKYLMATEFVLAILEPDESRVLGGSGFHLREGPLEGCSAEIGMWIRGSEAGRGLGTAVLRALLAWGFSEWPWLRLAWRCDTRNAASLCVAERAGMLREGTLRSHELAVDGSRRDTACFSALRDEWSDPGA